MKILIIDDHAISRTGTAAILHVLAESVVIVEAGTVEQSLELISKDPHLDLILLDLELPGMSGLDGMRELRASQPATPIVILSASEKQSDIKNAIAQGARGFITKSSGIDSIISALRLVLAGDIYLPMAIMNEVEDSTLVPIVNNSGDKMTIRQRQVLNLLVLGMTNKAIALDL